MNRNAISNRRHQKSKSFIFSLGSLSNNSVTKSDSQLSDLQEFKALSITDSKQNALAKASTFINGRNSKLVCLVVCN